MFSKPPTILRPLESHSEEENIEIAVTKLLLRSYYDIVRKNIEDSVPKAIMHFLVMIFLLSDFLLLSVWHAEILISYRCQIVSPSWCCNILCLI